MDLDIALAGGHTGATARTAMYVTRTLSLGRRPDICVQDLLGCNGSM